MSIILIDFIESENGSLVVLIKKFTIVFNYPGSLAVVFVDSDDALFGGFDSHLKGVRDVAENVGKGEDKRDGASEFMNEFYERVIVLIRTSRIRKIEEGGDKGFRDEAVHGIVAAADFLDADVVEDDFIVRGF